MSVNKSDHLQVLSRRSKVAELVLRGVTNQFEICARLGMEPKQQPTVSRDIKAIEEDWRRIAAQQISEARGRELERLDRVEREYWDAWERSKVERQSTRNRRRRKPTQKLDAEGRPLTETEDEDETKKEPRDGDARFLDGVLACVKKRCEILGIDAPKRLKHGGDEESPPIKVFGSIDWDQV